jgi:hypothetical protein
MAVVSVWRTLRAVRSQAGLRVGYMFAIARDFVKVARYLACFAA